MKLISVNVAQPREIVHEGQIVLTGIYKEPVAGPLMVRATNIEGDRQGDTKNHGGVHKAVYIYPLENYAYWQKELGRDDLTYGQFGENLTIEGLTEDQVHIGDVFRVGHAVFQVTQPRVPCYKLGHKMGSQQFIKQFSTSLRIGFYVRVLEEGEVEAGDTIELISFDPAQMSVRDVYHLLFFDKQNYAEAERAASIKAMAPGWRASFKDMVRRGRKKQG